MALILGVFDLLAYAIPGALYLAVFAYVSHRAGWIDVPTVLQAPTVLLLIGFGVAAFLLGQASFPLGSRLGHRNPFGSTDPAEKAKQEFLRRNSGAAERRFLQSDPFTLLAALEADDNEAAAEVSRLRATGLMLAGSVPPLLLGVAAAVVEMFTSSIPLFAGLTGLLLALVAVGCLRQAATFENWALIRTYELAYWNDDRDDRTADD